MAQLVGASSQTPKGCEFDYPSAHIPRLQVCSPVEVYMGGNDVSLTSMSLSLSISLSLSLCLSLKIPMAYFTKLEQIFQKCIWNYQRPHIAIAIFRKKNIVRGITPSDIKLYYKDIVFKTAQYWNIYRDIDEWNRMKSPEISTCLYGQLIFDKEARVYNGERQSIQ